MSKILIIDDDEMMCERFCILIDSLGHESECANSLEQGLAKASTDNFDIVLLDVYLPDGYGINLAAVYLVWLLVIALLYPVCNWFAGLKGRRKDWWLSYL